jgi:hypothetical protein
MKAKLGEFLVDKTFVSAYALELENGLVLRTNGNLAWAGREAHERTQAQFMEFVSELRAAGWEISGEIEEQTTGEIA